MIACSASWSWMLHDSAGKLLDLGRRRRPGVALRRAARERDRCRCRFPGCESRRVDLHHIQYWSHGGRTALGNLVSLRKAHHRLVHERGCVIAAARDGTFAFCRPDGTMLPSSPALPQADGTIGDRHDADITPGDDHPALVRRTAGPGPRHLRLLRQRPDPGGAASRARPGGRARGPGPGKGLRTGGLGGPDPPGLRRDGPLTFTLGQARPCRSEEGAGWNW